MEIVIAIYGAALATLIAIGQTVSAVRRRVRVGVSTGLTYAGLDERNRESAHGTPMQIRHGDDLLWNEVLLGITVRNEGGAPVQIVAVVIESLKQDGGVSISQFAPEPLPHVLDPGTRIEIAMQKEPIDVLDNVTFFGVTDALGRRYSAAREDVRNLILKSWELPTRVQKYVRKDDPTRPPVLAYENRERAALINTVKTGNKVAALVSRPPLLEFTPTHPSA